VRLFVALDISAEAIAELSQALRASSIQAPPGLRWVPESRWHLTLAFLGEIPDARVGGLCSRIGDVAVAAPPLRLRLAGAGRFGPRVLWVGVAGDIDGLGRLAHRIESAARRPGPDLEDRPYRPHLTVARSREGGDLGPLADSLASVRTSAWTADRVNLVRSVLGPTACHSTIAHWPMAGDRPDAAVRRGNEG